MNDVSRGIRMLLGRPLLTRSDDGFDLVTKNREPIGRWFEEHCNWRLHVEKRYALLQKTAKPDARRPARTADGTPFDRRRYELLCLACAELLETPVITKALLKQRVTTDAAFDDVLDFLERLGVLRPDEGKYRVDRELIIRLTERSTVDTIPLHRLLDDPVVYNEDLTPHQRIQLKNAHEAVAEAGFILEERAEGFLLVDPEGLATDIEFPDDSQAGTVALALLTRLPATEEELQRDTHTLIKKFRAYKDTDAEELTREAIDVLTQFGLAKQGNTIEARPAAARYRP